MRDCTILHTESSLGWGGQEVRIVTESAGMIKRGYRVLLACQPESRISKRAPEHGIETFVMRMDGAFDVVGIRSLRSLIRRESPQIINTHRSKDSWCAGLAARLSGGVKIVRTRHLGAPIRASFDTRLLYHTIPDAVITTGEALRQHVIERTGAKKEAVVSIPTGIDLSAFHPSAADGSGFRGDIGVAAGVPLVGTVSMLRMKKGLTYLIEAAAMVAREVPEVRFVIVGDTAFESPIKQLLTKRISELGIEKNLIMAGFRQDIPEVMAALDVFVLPSLMEGVPQVITQAMAMGRPVVGTNVGGIPEQVIDGETGYLIEKADSKQMADAILALLKNPDDAKRMALNGRKRAETHFGIDTMLDATERLYTYVLEQ